MNIRHNRHRNISASTKIKAGNSGYLRRMPRRDVDSAVKIRLRDKESIVEGEDPMDDAYQENEEVECATNSCNVSGKPILGLDDDEFYDIDDSQCVNCAVDLDAVDLDILYDIADMYTTSDPVSGDWDTETEHEMNTIADEFGISLDEAKQLMIDYLGFTPDMFDDANYDDSFNDAWVDVTDDISDVIESSENPYSDYYENEPSEWWYDHQPCDSYWYHTNHGVQPGSVPNGSGATVLDIQDDPDGGHFFKFNKLLRPEALEWFDITEKAPRL